MTEFPSSIKYIHVINKSHVTTELPIALMSAIRFVHPRPDKVHCTGEINYETEEILYIIICPAGMATNYDVVTPKYFITYQLEPTPVLDRKPYQRTLSKALYNWDYSRKNVNYLHDNTVTKSIYIPPGYSPYISIPIVTDGRYLYTDDGRDIDVLFLGYDQYERRKSIKQNLIKTGLNVVFICGLQLDGMQKLVRRAKVCINIHAILSCLETIRLNILLANQACVVNEYIDDDEVKVYEDYMITVPYDKLVDTCLELVNDTERRRLMALKSFYWYRRERDWNKIVDFNQLLPSLE